jgi:predicted ATPase
LLEKQRVSDDELILKPVISGVSENTGEAPSGSWWGGPSRGRRVRRAGTAPIGVDMLRFLPRRTISWVNQEAEDFGNLVEGSRYLLNRGANRAANSRLNADINELYDGLQPSTKENFGSLLESLITRAFTNSSTSFSRTSRSNIVSSFNQFDSVTDNLAEFLLGQTPEIRRLLAYELGTEQTQRLVRDLTRDLPENLDILNVSLPEPIGTSVEAIRRFFTQYIEYLGPLREEPLAVYNLPTSGNSTDVGLKGEYTAAVLHANKDNIITYWHPELDELVTDRLSQAVLDWLQYFGMADGVATSEAGSQGYRLTVRNPDVSHDLDLTNVGVGVSQVLPILVMGLIADEGSTLLYEQPEIHLHPATQARIADFFLGLIRTEKQCIIETHSEHFVNRVRLRIAQNEDPADPVGHPGNVQIMFAEKRDGSTQYREVEINEYGAIVDWPAGFFDESQRESEELIRAALAKRNNNA